MRLTRNSAVHLSNKAATRFTSNYSRWPRLKNSEHAQSDCGCGHGPKSGPAKTRGGCAHVIECNRSSSAHHRVCTFFPSPFNPVGKGSGHTQTTRDMAERQSPDGNKRPRGLPPGKTNSASS